MAMKKIIGLDVGQTAVKAVLLSMRGKTIESASCEIFNTHEEGIVDEVELRSSVIGWVREKGWSKADLSVGLPQYLATTQITDFPPGIAGEHLEEMVVYETRQLAGLSEEAFVSDYHVMSPKFGRKNPVLIGICRQSVVDERAEIYRGAGLRLVELSMNGLAVANTFFHLFPEAVELDAPQLLLDIGTETSTAIVVAGGQILSIGCLMFGSAKYTAALVEQHGCPQEEAERRKRTAAIDPMNADCPLRQATRTLENELRTAVDHWRAGERQEIANKMFAKVWLTGGGSQLRGLEDHFSRTYGCDAQVFGPRMNSDDCLRPDLTTAFGLALQGLERSFVSLSLCPTLIKWQRQKNRMFPYLAASVAILVIIATVLLARYYESLVEREKRLHDELVELRDCEQLVPRLEETMQAIRHREKMILPFAEKGNRARHFLQAMEALSKAKTDQDWIIYLADQFSYEEGKEAEEKKDKEPEEEDSRRRRRTPQNPLVFATSLSSLSRDEPQAKIDAIVVTDMEQLTSLVVAGFTPLLNVKKYEPVRAIAKNLNDSVYFEGVDLLPEPERAGREEGIFAPWMTYFQHLCNANQFGTDKSFFAEWERKSGLKQEYTEQLDEELGRLSGRMPKESLDRVSQRVESRIRGRLFAQQMKALGELRFTRFIFRMPLAELDINKMPIPGAEPGEPKTAP